MCCLVNINDAGKLVQVQNIYVALRNEGKEDEEQKPFIRIKNSIHHIHDYIYIYILWCIFDFMINVYLLELYMCYWKKSCCIPDVWYTAVSCIPMWEGSNVLSVFCFRGSFSRNLLVSGGHLQFSLRELSEAQNRIFKGGILHSKTSQSV